MDRPTGLNDSPRFPPLAPRSAPQWYSISWVQLQLHRISTSFPSHMFSRRKLISETDPLQSINFILQML